MKQLEFKLLKDIEIILKSKIKDSEIYDSLVQEISLTLQNYRIHDKSVSLICYNDENTRLLNRYKACLLVEGKSKQTIEAYSYRLQNMYDTLQKNLKEIGPYDIRFYFAILKQRGCCNRTLEVIRNYISAFYKWMSAEDIIEKNPCTPIKPIKYTEKIRESFTELDIDKLRTCCKNVKERAIVELLLSSGIRVSELENMNIDDVDFQTNTLHVKHGKGDKERVTYMSDIAAYYIDLYLHTRKDTCKELFRSKSGRLQSGGVRYLLTALGERANIRNVHPHRFRRTFATTLNNKGMAIQYIQHLLGHSKLDTTMIYVNVNDNVIHAEYTKYMVA